MVIEIVNFPINSMVIFHSYVKLPEGTWIVRQLFLGSNGSGVASDAQTKDYE